MPQLHCHLLWLQKKCETSQAVVAGEASDWLIYQLRVMAVS